MTDSGPRNDLESQPLELPRGRAGADTAAELVATKHTFVRMLVAVRDPDNGLRVIQAIADAQEVVRRFSKAVRVQECLLPEPVVLLTRTKD